MPPVAEILGIAIVDGLSRAAPRRPVGGAFPALSVKWAR